MGFIITKPAASGTATGAVQLIAQLENQSIGTAKYGVPFLESGKTAQPLYVELIATGGSTGPMPPALGQLQKVGNVGDLLTNRNLLGFKNPLFQIGKRIVYPIENLVIGNLNTTTDQIEFEVTQGTSGEWTINIFGYYS